MKRMILAASLVVVTASTAHATHWRNRISTYQALRRFLGRYSHEAFGSVRGFMATGYVVGIAIVDGVSSMEMFSKTIGQK